MLTITYKNGTQRFIRVTPAFYLDGTKDNELLSSAQLAAKVSDLASDFGPYREVYHSTLYNGNTLVCEYGPVLQNKPLSKDDVEEKIDESVQLKDLKKETKDYKQTQRILRNADGVFVTPIL